MACPRTAALAVDLQLLSGAIVFPQVCESTSDGGSQRWDTVASWEVDGVQSADWAAPEYGRVAAVATTTGQIHIYEQRYRHDKGRQLPGVYEQTASLSCGTSGIRCAACCASGPRHGACTMRAPARHAA